MKEDNGFNWKKIAIQAVCIASFVGIFFLILFNAWTRLWSAKKKD